MAQLKDLIVTGDARVVGNLYDNNPNVAFGTCTTAADQQHKVVTIANPTWALQVGTVIGVKFSYTNSFSSQTSTPITLNVNNTGNINIWYNTTHSGAGNTGTNTTAYGVANRVYYYMYDGTYWVWMNMGVTDGNDVSQVRQENGRVYAGTNGIARYSIIALDKDGKYQSLITLAATGTGTGKTINTGAKFKLNPVLRWYNANNDATSGNLIANTYALYSVHASVDTRYSHNHTVTFATNTPLYIECTIDSDGYWSPTTVCITQTLRSGYYYIYLGESYSTEYQVSLATDHPVYYYDGTNLNDYMQKYVADHSGGGGTATDVQINGTSITSNNVANILTNSAYSSSNKIATMSDLPSNNMVTQQNETGSSAFRILLSHNANDTTETGISRKSGNLTYNPSTKALSTGGTVNGYTLAAASAKAVDTSISASSSSANLPTSAAVATFVEGKGYVTTDTKNTAGSTNSSSKLFLIGATSQAANPQTYSQDTAYVGTDGHLYSNSVQVVNLSGSQALTNKTYNGYTLAAACAKAVVTSVDTSASLPTSNAVKTFVEGKGYKKITYGYVDPTGGSTDDIYIQLA